MTGRTRPSRLELQCYCCGEPIGARVALVSASRDALGRVFVMKPAHAVRADGVFELIARSKKSNR